MINLNRCHSYTIINTFGALANSPLFSGDAEDPTNICQTTFQLIRFNHLINTTSINSINYVDICKYAMPTVLCKSR